MMQVENKWLEDGPRYRRRNKRQGCQQNAWGEHDFKMVCLYKLNTWSRWCEICQKCGKKNWKSWTKKRNG